MRTVKWNNCQSMFALKLSVICRGFEEAGTMSPLTEKCGDILKKLGTFSHHFLKVPIAAN